MFDPPPLNIWLKTLYLWRHTLTFNFRSTRALNSPRIRCLLPGGTCFYDIAQIIILLTVPEGWSLSTALKMSAKSIYTHIINQRFIEASGGLFVQKGKLVS